MKRAWEQADPTKRYKVNLEDGRKAIERALSSFKSKKYNKLIKLMIPF